MMGPTADRHSIRLVFLVSWGIGTLIILLAHPLPGGVLDCVAIPLAIFLAAFLTLPVIVLWMILALQTEMRTATDPAFQNAAARSIIVLLIYLVLMVIFFFVGMALWPVDRIIDGLATGIICPTMLLIPIAAIFSVSSFVVNQFTKLLPPRP